MDFREAITKGEDAFTVKRVFAELYERDGIVVIPPAEIGGGWSGEDATRGGSEVRESGLNARPVGAYVVEGEHVRWQPALDVTRIALHVMSGALAVTLLPRRRSR